MSVSGPSQSTQPDQSGAVVGQPPALSTVPEPRQDDDSDTSETNAPSSTSRKSRTRRFRNKIISKIDHISNDFSRLGTAIATTVNPNHRHDEKHEQELDAKIQAIRDGHRFNSFSGEREGNIVNAHIDGHDFFYAISCMLESARESIFILDWWLTPELYLRRPPAKWGEEWRLDNVLKRKAEQGVRIYVMVYKEVTASMTMSSKHTKHALEDLHENIACMRHPDHSGGELVYYWSHHEKLVVVDNVCAGIGGLDLCFGRWDIHTHPLSDVHPTEWDRTLFPGQDYNNARFMDFQQVDRFTSNALAIQDTPRMPWHDVSITLMGPSVVDLSQHFIERWNFVKKIKYHHDHRMDWLALPEPWDDVRSKAEHEAQERRSKRRLEHPHLADWAERGRKFAHPFHWPPSDHPRAMEAVPNGHARIQVLRSSADWSHGILNEDSIQRAYIELIREANHTIYMENQFFVTACDTSGPVRNQIGAALAERIISAARDKRPFRIIIIIPAVPAFAGDVQSTAALKAIMQAQYRSINRGKSSIYETVREAGFDATDYISFWNLRGYDRVNSPKKFIEDMEKQSGVSFYEAQAALAKIWIGDKEDTANQKVVLVRGKDELEGEGSLGKGRRQSVNNGISLPKTIEEAWDTIKKFEQGAGRTDVNVSDNVSHFAFENQGDLTKVNWEGSEAEERDDWISELIYVHSKLLIVDDRRILIGSANINDRSQCGDRDSEIAIVIEDSEMMETEMAGKKYLAAIFATKLRRSLMREHLGLMGPQDACDKSIEPTPSMLPAPHISSYDFGSPDDKIVEDVLSPGFWEFWNARARKNRDCFQKVFRPIPNDEIKNWKDHSEYAKLSRDVLMGHIADPNLSLAEVKSILSEVKGHLVDMPIQYLQDVSEMTDGDFASV